MADICVVHVTFKCKYNIRYYIIIYAIVNKFKMFTNYILKLTIYYIIIKLHLYFTNNMTDFVGFYLKNNINYILSLLCTYTYVLRYVLRIMSLLFYYCGYCSELSLVSLCVTIHIILLTIIDVFIDRDGSIQ